MTAILRCSEQEIQLLNSPCCFAKGWLSVLYRYFPSFLFSLGLCYHYVGAKVSCTYGLWSCVINVSSLFWLLPSEGFSEMFAALCVIVLNGINTEDIKLGDAEIMLKNSEYLSAEVLCWGFLHPAACEYFFLFVK